MTSNLQLTLVEHRPPGVVQPANVEPAAGSATSEAVSPCWKKASQPVPAPQLIVSLSLDRPDVTVPAPFPVFLTWSGTGMRGGMIGGGVAPSNPAPTTSSPERRIVQVGDVRASSQAPFQPWKPGRRRSQGHVGKRWGNRRRRCQDS